MSQNIPTIISIEGNIGTGKSTLLEVIEKKIQNNNNNVIILKEPLDEWLKVKDKDGDILSKFYQDKTKYSFPFQLLILKTFSELISNTMTNNPDCTLIICERSILSSHFVFTKMLYDGSFMNEIEYQIYDRFFEQYSLFTPSKIVHLQTSPRVCLERINKRFREGENIIDLDYLEKCDMYHKLWLESIRDLIPILKINMDLDAIKSKDVYEIRINQIIKFCL
jgi:deoxyadenosine/deoxycytidine kinase